LPPAQDFLAFGEAKYGLESETLSAFGFPIYEKVILGFILQQMPLESNLTEKQTIFGQNFSVFN
jgi:hypothetical protein